ncbi:MAG: thiamine-phosphate kinase [Denitrovibrio sp.]|nr:MAG: thiamine-phosphate kinase [Denitrovibrio sp.]
MKNDKEFSLIEGLSKMLNKGGVTLGVGDDAALFGETLIAKDIMVEGVHFTKGAPFLHVMRKIVTANVSDIAAMGGTAKYALLGIAIPEGYRVDPADLVRSFEIYGVELIGGDTTSSKDSLFLSVTIIGEKNEHVLTRGGAKAGDLLYLSRPVGRVRELLEDEVAGGDVYNHYLVKAETKLGVLLGSTGTASACIDVSDGVGRDASHIADMSGVRIVIESDKMPVEHLSGRSDPVMYALGSGEEFALLFTVPEESKKEFEIMSAASILIGRVEEGSGVYLETESGYQDISQTGYEHKF